MGTELPLDPKKALEFIYDHVQRFEIDKFERPELILMNKIDLNDLLALSRIHSLLDVGDGRCIMIAGLPVIASPYYQKRKVEIWNLNNRLSITLTL